MLEEVLKGRLEGKTQRKKEDNVKDRSLIIIDSQ